MTTVLRPGLEADLPSGRPRLLASPPDCAAVTEAAALGPARPGRPRGPRRGRLLRATSRSAATPTRTTRRPPWPRSKSWSAWFFGSFDAANFITVDKPPLAHDAHGPVGPALRPELVEHPPARGPGRRRNRCDPVRRRPPLVRAGRGHDRRRGHGAHPGRRPDLPLQQPRRPADPAASCGAAWALLRALETGRLRWLVLVAVLVGLAFNTKFLQAFLVAAGLRRSPG